MKIAICPGSFDPVTLGHLDIIARASSMFDKVIAAILVNPEKKTMFSPIERKEMLKQALKEQNIPNVQTITFDGLLMDCAKKYKANVVVRGLRAVSDFEYEFQMSLMNKNLAPDIETVFLTTNLQYMYLSSSVIKQLDKFDADVSQFLPKCVLQKLHNKI